MVMDEGMDMTEAVTKFSGGMPRLMYVLSTDLPVIENPVQEQLGPYRVYLPVLTGEELTSSP